ncbi:hypothetical protein AVEN_274151-1 [Araneus ventricosus]|uniref:Uncharacterized protein n=1 Tax=Araneus ventricosus TaxID=182803 RepID=A0A4Y2G444_ARAVE|nr:hypothetical protein AVEN_274151-1 [Araneus ventricosus]
MKVAINDNYVLPWHPNPEILDRRDNNTVLWLITKWSALTQAPTPHLGGTPRHRECGQYNHATIAIYPGDARTCLLLTGNFSSMHLWCLPWRLKKD